MASAFFTLLYICLRAMASAFLPYYICLHAMVSAFFTLLYICLRAMASAFFTFLLFYL